ncbi:MAG: carbon-nitrogen hydrolase family protein [Rhodobacteraceae bacterium]|nr:carbon-nitrogen hydrolase family protein [Paracoccaceae bacterium]
MDGFETLTVALAQLAPVWLDRQRTTDKVCDAISEAAARGAALVAFGEAFLPGYPFWLERTGGAAFNSPDQKNMYRHYLQQAVSIADGDLTPVCRQAAQHGISVILGTAERPVDRGGHSIYCTLVHIDARGAIPYTHRKLMPTYDERLTWATGDGYGLRTRRLGAFTLSALNCWENWMPLIRAALYAQGADLHVALWPGGQHITRDITRFVAQEGRLYALSVSGLMRPSDFPPDTPMRDLILRDAPACLADGGTCAAGPDGRWILEPQVGSEAIHIVTLDPARIAEERQNFDPAGHYSRPDVARVEIDRTRQTMARFVDE